MDADKIPMTQAIRFLKAGNAVFIPRPYRYEEHGGTARAAAELGFDEHAVIKTLVMEDEKKAPLIVLMHGDREVSTKSLARTLGVKSVTPCDPATANRHTGYLVGGTSPFGTRKPLPIYAESAIFELPRILINGGQRGFLVEIEPAELDRLLKVRKVTVARD